MCVWEQWGGRPLMRTKAAAMRVMTTFRLAGWLVNTPPTPHNPHLHPPLSSSLCPPSTPSSVCLHPLPPSLSLMSDQHCSSIWCSAGVNKRKWLEEWSIWAVCQKWSKWRAWERVAGKANIRGCLSLCLSVSCYALSSWCVMAWFICVVADVPGYLGSDSGIIERTIYIMRQVWYRPKSNLH